MKSNKLSVIDQKGPAGPISLVSLPQATQSPGYWYELLVKSPAIPNESPVGTNAPIEEPHLTKFKFCGQIFYAEPLLGLTPDDKRLPLLTEQLVGFMEELNRLGDLACTFPDHRNHFMAVPIFVSGDKTFLFMAIVDRLTRLTSWRVEFLPSRINPIDGRDARIIVPE
ncbi:MAG: hypothetical protein AAB381_03520 [Patescibacteria group bacterium]